MRRLLPLLCSVVVVSTLIACGDDGGRGDETVTADHLAAVLAAPEETVDAESARVTYDMRMTVEGETLEMRGEGVMSLRESVGQLTFEMSGIPGAGTVEIEQILDGTTIYVRSPMLAQAGLGDAWIAIDLEDAGAMAGVDLSQVGTQQSDPTQVLAYLRGAADDVQEVGTENVRGEETTHYRATVDLRRAGEHLDGVTDEEAFEQVIDRIGADTLDIDVWIDGDGRARRLAVEMPFETPDGEAGIDMAIGFHDFGTEVDVQPPPPDQVTDIGNLTGGAPEGGDQ